MTINLNIKEVHVHLPEQNCDFLEVLGGIASQLEDLGAQSKREKKRMALSAEEQAIVDRFNAGTSAVAALIRDLRDNPPANDTEFNAKLSEIADGLDALGKPGTPVPGPGPQPTP